MSFALHDLRQQHACVVAGDGTACPADSLKGESVEEQKHILRDIWLQSHRQTSTYSSNDRVGAMQIPKRGRPPGTDVKAGKQMRISALFTKK